MHKVQYKPTGGYLQYPLFNVDLYIKKVRVNQIDEIKSNHCKYTILPPEGDKDHVLI